MKKYFIPFLLSIGFPLSVSATNYVECEAIRAVIVRTDLQKETAKEENKELFIGIKVKEKYGEYICPKDPTKFYSQDEECLTFTKNVWRDFKEEGEAYVEESLGIYDSISERAKKDFKKRGCYWF